MTTDPFKPDEINDEKIAHAPPAMTPEEMARFIELFDQTPPPTPDGAPPPPKDPSHG